MGRCPTRVRGGYYCTTYYVRPIPEVSGIVTSVPGSIGRVVRSAIRPRPSAGDTDEPASAPSAETALARGSEDPALVDRMMGMTAQVRHRAVPIGPTSMDTTGNVGHRVRRMAAMTVC